jgi:transposase
MAMTFYAALDVSLEKTAVCVMGRDGSIIRELEVATCPEALARCLGKIAPAFELVGLEAGSMSEWLVLVRGSFSGGAYTTPRTLEVGLG